MTNSETMASLAAFAESARAFTKASGVAQFVSTLPQEDERGTSPLHVITRNGSDYLIEVEEDRCYLTKTHASHGDFKVPGMPEHGVRYRIENPFPIKVGQAAIWEGFRGHLGDGEIAYPEFHHRTSAVTAIHGVGLPEVDEDPYTDEEFSGLMLMVTQEREESPGEFIATSIDFADLEDEELEKLVLLMRGIRDARKATARAQELLEKVTTLEAELTTTLAERLNL